MKVLLRNPRREIDVDDARSVVQLLDRLGLPREAHLVIRNGTLVPGDARLAADDDVGTKASFYLNFLDTASAHEPVPVELLGKRSRR